MRNIVTVIGGGLAGSEAAWQLAERGIKVKLYEMRPEVQTGAHQGSDLGELICSNSLGSNLPDRASGVLKNELRAMNSLLIKIADQVSVPAGSALAVDRTLFARAITEQLSAHPNIVIIREEVKQLPTSGITILASGPLTSNALAASIAQRFNKGNLFFYDAISPIISAESIDMDIAYTASRYDNGEEIEGDYVNCPFHDKQDYLKFYSELSNAERIELREFETPILEGVDAGDSRFFEGCLPVEIIATRGEKALLYGPLRPVGLKDPRVERPPYAVVQLRKENLSGDMLNLVGFQTNLTFKEQRRVLRMIPGLQNAEFLRYGQMHRNTFISAPEILTATLQSKQYPELLMAGQITGVEGYAGNIATGLFAGINAAKLSRGETPVSLPVETMLGALCRYITESDLKSFQPMKANFGILPELEGLPKRSDKRYRARLYAERSEQKINEILPALLS